MIPRTLKGTVAPLRRLWQQRQLHRASRARTKVRPEEIPLAKPEGQLRVLWVLAGNEWLGSARLKGILLDQFFQTHDAGLFSRLAYMPSQGEYLDPVLTWDRRFWQPLLRRGIDVVCFQTHTGKTESLLEECHAFGIATVFSISDLVLEQIPRRVFELSNAVVVSSELLAKRVHALHQRVELIDDPVDVPSGWARRPSSRTSDQLELIWLGHPDHWGDIVFLREVLDCDDLRSFSLRTISRHPEATHQWTPQTVWEDARRSDIAVIPCQLDERGKAKSSNRLACFMALGYPVIATPIPAYAGFIRHGVDGFLATSVEEWRDGLRRLRDPIFRQQIGDAAARAPMLEAVRLSTVAGSWAGLFRSLRCDRRQKLNAERID